MSETSVCPQNDIKLTSKMYLTSLFKDLLNQKSLGCVEIRKKMIWIFLCYTFTIL